MSYANCVTLTDRKCNVTSFWTPIRYVFRYESVDNVSTLFCRTVSFCAQLQLKLQNSAGRRSCWQKLQFNLSLKLDLNQSLKVHLNEGLQLHLNQGSQCSVAWVKEKRAETVAMIVPNLAVSQGILVQTKLSL